MKQKPPDVRAHLAIDNPLIAHLVNKAQSLGPPEELRVLILDRDNLYPSVVLGLAAVPTLFTKSEDDQRLIIVMRRADAATWLRAMKSSKPFPPNYIEQATQREAPGVLRVLAFHGIYASTTTAPFARIEEAVALEKASATHVRVARVEGVN